MDTIAESTIYSTTDYGKFQFLPGNRVESASHVRNLIRSFSKNPELARTRPILVNDEFEIIDGQHRYQACVSLGIPVYYTVANGIDVGTARLMNANQKGWSTKDFLNSFIAEDNETYVKLKQLWEEYPIPFSQLLMFCHTGDRKSLMREFKEGKYQFMKDKTFMYKRLDNLEALRPFFKYWNHAKFVGAYWNILHNGSEFDPERLVKKAEITEMKGQATERDYMREIERVYNFKVEERHYVTLFR